MITSPRSATSLKNLGFIIKNNEPVHTVNFEQVKNPNQQKESFYLSQLIDRDDFKYSNEVQVLHQKIIDLTNIDYIKNIKDIVPNVLQLSNYNINYKCGWIENKHNIDQLTSFLKSINKEEFKEWLDMLLSFGVFNLEAIKQGIHQSIKKGQGAYNKSFLSLRFMFKKSFDDIKNCINKQIDYFESKGVFLLIDKFKLKDTNKIKQEEMRFKKEYVSFDKFAKMVKCVYLFKNLKDLNYSLMEFIEPKRFVRELRDYLRCLNITEQLCNDESKLKNLRDNYFFDNYATA